MKIGRDGWNQVKVDGIKHEVGGIEWEKVVSKRKLVESGGSGWNRVESGWNQVEVGRIKWKVGGIKRKVGGIRWKWVELCGKWVESSGKWVESSGKWVNQVEVGESSWK